MTSPHRVRRAGLLARPLHNNLMPQWPMGTMRIRAGALVNLSLSVAGSSFGNLLFHTLTWPSVTYSYPVNLRGMNLSVAKLKSTFWRKDTPSQPEAYSRGIVNGCALHGQKQKNKWIGDQPKQEAINEMSSHDLSTSDDYLSINVCSVPLASISIAPIHRDSRLFLTILGLLVRGCWAELCYQLDFRGYLAVW